MDPENKPLMDGDVEYAPSSAASEDSIFNAEGESKEFDEERLIFSKS